MLAVADGHQAVEFGVPDCGDVLAYSPNMLIYISHFAWLVHMAELNQGEPVCPGSWSNRPSMEEYALCSL